RSRRLSWPHPDCPGDARVRDGTSVKKTPPTRAVTSGAYYCETTSSVFAKEFARAVEETPTAAKPPRQTHRSVDQRYAAAKRLVLDDREQGARIRCPRESRNRLRDTGRTAR